MLNADVMAFIKVVEMGSFTQAAIFLNTSKARVSQQVSKLEAALGTTLLHRTTRKIRLTEVGETYFDECQRAAHILQLAERQLHEKQNDETGIIRLNSVGGLFAERILTPAITAFLLRYPQIKLELDLTSHQIDLLSEQFDLVIRMGALVDSTLVGRELMQLSTHVVASPLYLTQIKKLVTPKQLIHANCLCGSVKKWHFEHTKTQEKVDVNVSGSLAAANGHVICQAALAGLGVARLNALYTQAHLEHGKLVTVFDDWQSSSQPVSLVYPKARYKTKRIQLFVDFLVDWFR
ncbi:LysR family transcriptional regulator [Algibacillus agarilyticus]|uniref:LysR family transcriptional regulator n=1 Tax=Algibacillus agarilyticus TaxID=2234133 RepID=UPI000DCFE61D|nr:LysR family transcriptional regulator [Algibacillus agarilyticus]